MKETDRIICKLLEQNARTSLSEIAETVGLSVTSVSEHIKKLEEQGVIEGYHTKISAEALDLDITSFIFVSVESSAHYPAFLAQCRKASEILECHAVTGDATHVLKVRVENTAALERLLSRIQQWNGVHRTETNLVLSTQFETFALFR
ncbi:MAG: Lrp/AsnC family transcriptional regulator [Candidatus Kapaibacterium sp.]